MHVLLQLPQCTSSAVRSVSQPSSVCEPAGLQSASPELQRATHLPATHLGSSLVPWLEQVRPQEPQWSGSELVSTQAPSHRVAPEQP